MSKAKAQRAWLGVEEKRFGLTRSGLLASEPCTPGAAALAGKGPGTACLLRLPLASRMPLPKAGKGPTSSQGDMRATTVARSSQRLEQGYVWLSSASGGAAPLGPEHLPAVGGLRVTELSCTPERAQRHQGLVVAQQGIKT